MFPRESPSISRVACTAWPPRMSRDGAISSTRISLAMQSGFEIDLAGHTRARRFEDLQTPDRRTNSVAYRYRRRNTFADRVDKTLHLRVVALLGEEFTARFAEGPLHVQPLEILGRDSEPLGECFHPLSARSLTAHSAICQRTDRAVGEPEGSHDIILPDRI